ncbi:carboxylesterase family protein [Streptomyces phaeochromogenes]|uniref:carboxylesterase family protein n=1 Tax=Streptomyces phaeochromogenes TaxID=1923 RepID=UPI0033F3A67A
MRSVVLRRLAALVSLLALLNVVSTVPASAAPHSLTVSTDKGTVAGTAAAGVNRFLGIPYAAPPTDVRRWQPPAPASAWPGVRPATSYGSRCPQSAAGDGPAVRERDQGAVRAGRQAGVRPTHGGCRTRALPLQRL